MARTTPPLVAPCVGGLLALLPTLACAVDPNPADGQWRGNATLAVGATSGNTRTASVLMKGDAIRLTDSDKIVFGGSGNYARSKVDDVDTVTAKKANLFGQYDYNLDRRAVLFGRLSADRDELSLLSIRLAGAGGLGWKMINEETDKFTLYAGLGYSRDRYSQPQTINGTTATLFERTNLLLAEESSHQFSSTVSFKQRFEVAPSIGGDRSTLLKLTADLTVALNSTMSLSVGVIDTYNTKPPAGLKRNDASFFTGLNVKFGAH